ncbi:MAG: GerMN domain-containing protein [Acidobacteria bacterium]|nr:GerMN domain-containing protein [Acidobacteriota bacterium]
MRKTLALTLLLIAVSSSVLTQTVARRFKYIQPGAISAKALAVKEATPIQKTQEVKVYLVALNDAGKSGKKIGCDDSLVAVTRTIKATGTPLKAALRELVAGASERDGELGNYVFGPNLRVKSVSISRGTATIRFSGQISVAGVCDMPRITEQIDATAKQFPNVKRVRVFVGKRTLSDAIS